MATTTKILPTFKERVEKARELRASVRNPKLEIDSMEWEFAFCSAMAECHTESINPVLIFISESRFNDRVNEGGI